MATIMSAPTLVTVPRSPVLADYPWVASCRRCQEYTASYPDLAASETVPATLAHHDSCHRKDFLTLASQHFG